MKIALLAASGRAGLTILQELITRGHEVVAVVRDINKLPMNLPDSVTAIVNDLSDSAKIAKIIAGTDAVVSAYGPPRDDPRFVRDLDYTDVLPETIKRFIAAVEVSKVPRLLMVGGAGSLWFSPGVTVLESGFWPEAFVPIARSHVKAFAALRHSTINWTYFSPPMLIDLGERTGNFRLGGDELIVDSSGKSWVSFEDYAVAVVDELEQPKHERQRFTIGY